MCYLRGIRGSCSCETMVTLLFLGVMSLESGHELSDILTGAGRVMELVLFIVCVYLRSLRFVQDVVKF